MSINHNFWRERRAEAELNHSPSAYQLVALPLGQSGSHPGCVWYYFVFVPQLLHSCLKSGTLKPDNAEHLGFLEPLVPSLVECLSLKYVRVGCVFVSVHTSKEIKKITAFWLKLVLGGSKFIIWIWVLSKFGCPWSQLSGWNWFWVGANLLYEYEYFLSLDALDKLCQSVRF